jgi:hypothetical protein
METHPITLSDSEPDIAIVRSPHELELMTRKVIAVLKFNQQDNGDRTTR